MKKILIISDSVVGKHFIQRVINTYTSENIYYIVQMRAVEYENANYDRFKFYEFDPTSLYKLANLLKMDFLQVFVVMDKLVDVENTIKNIRAIKKQLRVVVLNKWNLESGDSNISLINFNEIMSSRMLDYLPNVPVIAQNVGIGEGEIMEVIVPFGSSFVYRHIGAIEQKNWRIVAIYRNRKLIIPSRNKMIHPNDLLVLVGEPEVLKLVYRSIKKELGQFPEPFGSSLYLYIDMNIINKLTIVALVRRAVFANKKFEHNLIIKIVNPNAIEIVQEIKDFRSDSVIVNIEYNSSNLEEKFHNDMKLYHVGLIIVSKDMFAENSLRNTFYEAHLPVLKLADKSFSSVKDTVLILRNNRDLEKISATIFDISEQMGFNIELYNYMKEHQEEKEQVIEHYNNLSNIFSKTIKVIKNNENPIRTLHKKDNFLQILPFTYKLTQKRIYSLFSIDSERLYYKLDEYHQLFIPIQL